MVFAEDIRRTILKIADERGSGNAFSPRDVASRVDKKNQNELMEQVCLVASVLVREGKIDSVNTQDTSVETPLFIKKR